VGFLWAAPRPHAPRRAPSSRKNTARFVAGGAGRQADKTMEETAGAGRAWRDGV